MDDLNKTYREIEESKMEELCIYTEGKKKLKIEVWIESPPW